MSNDDPADFFAPPAFKPAEALLQLRRHLREQRGLAERGAGFDWKGSPVITLEATQTALQASIAKRPARAPEWESRTLADSAQVRRFLDEAKQRLARWREADE